MVRKGAHGRRRHLKIVCRGRPAPAPRIAFGSAARILFPERGGFSRTVVRSTTRREPERREMAKRRAQVVGGIRASGSAISARLWVTLRGDAARQRVTVRSKGRIV